MSRKFSPTAIGAFIMAGIGLLIVGIMTLSPDVGEERQTYQLYFEGSVKGLDVGAPVLVKGVLVGRVRSIGLLLDSIADDQQGFLVPVTVEISNRRLLASASDKTLRVTDLIEKGLRAQLQLDSFVTQKLFVELDFNPADEPLYYDQFAGEFPQIPTVQTGWQTLQSELSDIDMVQMIAKASSALDGLNRILNGPEAIQTLTAMENSLSSLDQLVSGLNQDREALTESVRLTLLETRQTFADARSALRRMEELLQSGQSVSDDTQQLVKQIDTTLIRVDQLVRDLNSLVQEDSPTVYKAEATLDEVSGAARALRQFLELLEDQPDALLRGR